MMLTPVGPQRAFYDAVKCDLKHIYVWYEVRSVVVDNLRLVAIGIT